MRLKNVIITCFLCLSILGTYSAINPINTQAKSSKSKQKIDKHGPPPHAPAHGYRYKHEHGVELEYDSGLGVYVVIGMPGVYYHNGLYIKYSDGQWRVTAHFNGSWRAPVNEEIPVTLKKTKKSVNKGKAKGKKKIKKK